MSPAVKTAWTSVMDTTSRGETLPQRLSRLGLNISHLDESMIGSYPHQVGGHRVGDGNESSRDVVLLKNSDGTLYLLKPLQNDDRGVREIFFYRFQSELFSRFTPSFHGLYRTGSLDDFSACLQDCTAGLRFPCVADIKIGKVTYDELATPEKKQKELLNYKWQSELGFRFVGIKSYRNGTFTTYGKPFGKAISPDTVNLAWSTFLNCGHSIAQIRQIIDKILSKLRTIADFMQTQSEFRLYSSSILVAFDSDPELDAIAVGSVRVNMIDFGHAFPILDHEGRDDNYLFGINRLINSLAQYQQNHCP
uniref:Kinase n=1 Tax=Spongospora subterranea TaxID=70186 RepID=A0A0H5QUK1_9EUKA|eukprot:CRZ05688.1 hypothetical protein [Spongospora subterranea]